MYDALNPTGLQGSARARHENMLRDIKLSKSTGVAAQWQSTSPEYAKPWGSSPAPATKHFQQQHQLFLYLLGENYLIIALCIYNTLCFLQPLCGKKNYHAGNV